MTGVRLRGVGKRYGRGSPYVLRGVDATLAPGDLVHVQGNNGSGKSTLLRVLAGVSAPSTGSISGRPPGTGFVPERFPPTVRFTARDYLRHLAAIRRTRVEESVQVLDRLGAARFLDRPMTQLSKGTCQKVALAQALAGPPGLLVLDEAWTGLDTDAQQVLTDAVRAYAGDGGIVVLTEHARRTAAIGPTRHWRIAGGEVQESSAAHSLAVHAEAARVVLDGPSGRSTVEIEPTACDALLAAALAAGWSVHDVRRRER